MTTDLDRLAERLGIAAGYVSETGERRSTAAEAKRGVIGALGFAAATDEEIRASLAALPEAAPYAVEDGPAPVCHLPAGLIEHPAWGVACQLYGLRSARNLGIGDFDDLGQLAEVTAGMGADFLGVNPLHALFWANPLHRSPYAPSSRRFLNPLYIAVDRLAEDIGVVMEEPAEAADARASELVDYAAAAALKHDLLRQLFASFEERHAGGASPLWQAFTAFQTDGGEALQHFALFETLSEAMNRDGYGAGWSGWPAKYRRPDSDEVRRFAEAHGNAARFHVWLQWCADRQLAEAQRRARAAGMRIGLYIDLAVGVTPDGAATWAAPDSVIAGARAGAPPDRFNARGQDWGIAPLSPLALAAEGGGLFREELESAMRHAGAIRIDHAMSLQRLYWIPGNADATGGAYVAYPMERMLRTLAEASRKHGSIVIGEDLGTVPEEFRERMSSAGVLSYRVAYFERDSSGRFLPGPAYPREALACVGTHDMPTLRGWWRGADIALRRNLGLITESEAECQRAERQRERLALIQALAEEGLIEKAAMETFAGAGDLPVAVGLGLHVMLAKAPSVVFAVQLEDLLGVEEQVNLPGTVDEHPNWRRRMPCELSALARREDVVRLAAAVAAERPRP